MSVWDLRSWMSMKSFFHFLFSELLDANVCYIPKSTKYYSILFRLFLPYICIYHRLLDSNKPFYGQNSGNHY